MITISYKGTDVGSYTGDEIAAFFHPCYLLYENTLQSEKKPVPEITSTESFEVRKLKYLAQHSLLLRLLDNHPEYLQKILELDHMNIQKVGSQEYASYLESLIEEDTVVFSADNSEFVKKFDLDLLSSVYKILPDLLNNEQELLKKNNFNTIEHKIDCHRLVQILPSLIEKLNMSLQKIQNLKSFS